tara:strand:- start:179 stop:337 length:159 start_codon:yes stop_codon:yes gene_type:complete
MNQDIKRQRTKTKAMCFHKVVVKKTLVTQEKEMSSIKIIQTSNLESQLLDKI